MATPDVDIGREPLSRDRILAAGVELADAEGLAGLSMRKLAAHLGFEVMSLYNHVASKRDLLEGMIDLVQGEVVLPDPGSTGWKAGIRRLAVEQHEMLLRHRWVGPLTPTHFPGPHGWRFAERLLELLSLGDLSGHLRDVGYHAVTLHVSGFTAQQIAYDFDEADAAEMYARVDLEFAAEDYPLMADHIQYHVDPTHTPGERPDEFRFVLDLILDGLERARDADVGSDAAR